jgi:transposase InsO family protein
MHLRAQAEIALLRARYQGPRPLPAVFLAAHSETPFAMSTRRLRAMGIRDKPIAPASPWQNGFVERLIGSIRRECLDHIIVLGEAHLRRILKFYARYYNETRTHLALDKDAPVSRPVQRTGVVRSLAIAGPRVAGVSPTS